jgi:hypothetical protein
VVGRKGKVQVNGKPIGSNQHVVLNGGDELVFGNSGGHAYVSFHPCYCFLSLLFVTFVVGSFKMS